MNSNYLPIDPSPRVPLGGNYWDADPGVPLWGFADLHAHLMAHLAFGGRAFWGKPYDPEGVKLIRELRRQDRTRELPVIVVSAIADQAKRRLNGGAFGIIDWLEKPLDETRLLSAVQMIAIYKQGLPRILHVEDDPIIYEMVRVLLRGQVDLVLAPSLFDAHKKLREEVFDLILLDMELSDGSGLDLIRDLDDVEYMPQVVIFSAHEVGNDVAQKVKAALVKSKDSRKELIDVIMSVIKERDAGDTPQQYLN